MFSYDGLPVRRSFGRRTGSPSYGLKAEIALSVSEFNSPVSEGPRVDSGEIVIRRESGVPC
jgi:hypothetical protein